jgi:hypothetical protein
MIYHFKRWLCFMDAGLSSFTMGQNGKAFKAAGSSPQQPCPSHLERAAPGDPQRLDAMDLKESIR